MRGLGEWPGLEPALSTLMNSSPLVVTSWQEVPLRSPCGWEEDRVPRVSSVHQTRCFWDWKLHKDNTEESVANGSS